MSSVRLDGYLLTDSGLETDLIFHHGLDLPEFAAFVLLDDAPGTETLRAYYRAHAAVAAGAGVGFVLESPTWRAGPEWGARLGYPIDAMADLNRRAIELLRGVADEFRDRVDPLYVSGCVGPRGDGYVADEVMTADEAQAHHGWQVERFAEAGVDLVTAMTITNVPEGIGVVRAAAAAAVPSVLSFTVETDGRLPDGTALGEAVEAVDAATGGAAAWFAVNCAHPTHFEDVLATGDAWLARLGGIRANASRRSHAELDEAEELDDGDPDELAADYRRLVEQVPSLRVLGGCCGTDVRHIGAIAATSLGR